MTLASPTPSIGMRSVANTFFLHTRQRSESDAAASPPAFSSGMAPGALLCDTDVWSLAWRLQ